MVYVLDVVQTLLLLVLAPLLQGWIKLVKARMQGRVGPPLLQPYRDLHKYFRKDVVISESASSVTRWVPYLQIGILCVAAAMVPVLVLGPATVAPLGGSFFAFLFLLSATRIAILLLGLDSGSAFGGMGASRDAFFTLFMEPTVLLSFLALGLQKAAYTLGQISAGALFAPDRFAPANVLVAVTLLFVVIVETGRLPIDNPDTHLELTMIHEGNILDLAGRQLALVQWGATIRQMIWFTLFIDLAVPYGIADPMTIGSTLIALVAWVGKLAVLSALVAVVETLSAKVRFFYAPKLLGYAFAFAMFALLTNFLF